MSRNTKDGGRRVVMRGDTVTIPRSEYDRLLAKAGESSALPPLPQPDASGNFPAVEFMRAAIARTLIQRRQGAGLSQTELAERAGVRQETISRIESGKHTATERVMQKIERALDAAAMKSRQRR